MQTYQLLILAGLISTGAMLFVSLVQLSKKLNTRQRVIAKLSKDYAFLEELKRLKASKSNESEYRKEIERVQKIIADCIKDIEDPMRVQIEAPMYQRSAQGRERYIERIAHDVDLELSQAA